MKVQKRDWQKRDNQSTKKQNKQAGVVDREKGLGGGPRQRVGGDREAEYIMRGGLGDVRMI